MSSIDRKKEILEFATEYVKQLLGSGTHTSRVFRCTMVLGVLAAGATLPNFIFRKRAFTMTRGR